MEDILSREYQPWDRPHLLIDSATMPPDEAAEHIARVAR